MNTFNDINIIELNTVLFIIIIIIILFIYFFRFIILFEINNKGPKSDPRIVILSILLFFSFA